jgi:hypothetical protein
MVTAKNKNYEIGKWLQGLLENLTDGDDKPIFKKVLLGFDEQKIKTFGDGVLATVYITGADYQETFGIHNRPAYVKSNIAFIIKGNSEARYNKAIRIYDLLQELLETNQDWQKLIDETNNKRIVRDTDVINSSCTLSPVGKKLSIIGFFELRHHVFK